MPDPHVNNNIPDNIETILHIGAGECQELPVYIASSVERIILVEPNPLLAEKLRQKMRDDARISVLEVAVSNDPGRNLLGEYNLPEADSIYTPTGLTQFFPGLRRIQHHSVSIKKPEVLLNELSIRGEHNLLILQAPGAELAIIKALVEHGLLGVFSHIWLTASRETFYDSGSDAERVLALLKEADYSEERHCNRNQEWPQWQLNLPPLARAFKALKIEKRLLSEALQKSNSELVFKSATLEKVQKELEEVRVEHQHERELWLDQKQKLEQECLSYKNKLVELEKQLRKADKAFASLEQVRKSLEKEEQEKIELYKRSKKIESELDKFKAQCREAEKDLQGKKLEFASEVEKRKILEIEVCKQKEQIDSLSMQMEWERENKDQLEALGKKVEYLFSQQTLQMEQAANAIGKHISLTAKNTIGEVSASIALQHQFGGKLPALESNGKRLPSSDALQISRLLDAKPYDLIIELGCGASTSFMAQALRNQIAVAQGESTPNQASQEQQLAHYLEPSESDLPKRIVCFEHNRDRCKQLADWLQQAGLSPFIGLQFSPLVSCSYKNHEYLFYDCAAYLQRIAELFVGRQAKILVLLNEPSGTAKPDFLPALPQLLQHLSTHTVDLLFGKWCTTSLQQDWYHLLEERGLEHVVTNDLGDSQLQILTVNP